MLSNKIRDWIWVSLFSMIHIMDSKYEIIVVGGGFVGLTLTGKLLKFKNLRVTILESDQEKLKNLKNGSLGVQGCPRSNG